MWFTQSADDKQLSNLQLMLLVVEGLILLFITLAFWYHIDPNIALRNAWYWTLWLALPIFAVRFLLFRRLLTPTPLHILIGIFIIISIFSYHNALYQREAYLAPMARPLLGIWTFIYFVEVSRATKRLQPVVIFLVGMSFVMGSVALTTSDWKQDKTGFLWDTIQTLPRFDYRALATTIDTQICSPAVDVIHQSNCFNPSHILRYASLGFNVNEIGGALAWVAPMMAGIALTSLSDTTSDNDKTLWRVIRICAGLTFFLVMTALIFGQSRFAIMGVLLGLMIVVIFGVSNWRVKLVSVGLFGLIILLQISLLFNFFAPVDTNSEVVETEAGVSGRDAQSVEMRFGIWESSMQMMQDYPIAGVGMYMFRRAVSTEPYEVEIYIINGFPNPPHAHNEWLNMGAEMGWLGLFIFVAMQVVVIWMLWYGWVNGDHLSRQMALVAFAGLLAHAVYGLGDTIALWDRFQFVLWWVVGLAASQYIFARSLESEQIAPDAAHPNA